MWPSRAFCRTKKFCFHFTLLSLSNNQSLNNFNNLKSFGPKTILNSNWINEYKPIKTHCANFNLNILCLIIYPLNCDFQLVFQWKPNGTCISFLFCSHTVYPQGFQPETNHCLHRIGPQMGKPWAQEILFKVQIPGLELRSTPNRAQYKHLETESPTNQLSQPPRLMVLVLILRYSTLSCTL